MSIARLPLTRNTLALRLGVIMAAVHREEISCRNGFRGTEMSRLVKKQSTNIPYSNLVV